MKAHPFNYYRPTRQISLLISLIVLFSFLVGGCSLLPFPAPTPSPAFPTPPPATPIPETMLTFRVTVPAALAPGDSLYLTAMDEVTGLAINPNNFVMTAEDAVHYQVILPFRLGSVIKYRYTRLGAYTVQEHISDGRAVRYRLYDVTGPGMVEDVITRWTDTSYDGLTGRISGQVTDAQNGQPLPNLLISAGGVQVLTASDGSYLLEGLPPGTHNLVAYSLDGSYRTYQQGAVVAPNSTTPAPLQLQVASLVNVVFTVVVPDNTPPTAVIRFAGNLIQLGNTFADLKGGGSGIAARMPILGRLPDGRYTITLTLPSGTDLRYKYTLGDGLWSAEHSQNGEFRFRQLIVPETNLLISDWVDTWNSANSAPIIFIAKAPANTLADDAVSIQFNPGYGWTEPIPMWPLGNNEWTFTLTSPLDITSNISYRYCREDQCSIADDADTPGPDAVGRPITTGLVQQEFVDTIRAWAWMPTLPQPATVPSVVIQPRGPSFVAGIEFLASYDPTWGPRWQRAVTDVKNTGANWLYLTPTWTYTRVTPPVLEPVTGRDALWPELSNLILQARNSGLNVAVFPTPIFAEDANKWWVTAPRDFSWWVVWYEHYRGFLLHHADLASRNGAQMLVVGGDWLAPSLPGGMLADGSLSGAPADAEARWRSILAEVRTRFKGTIVWALSYPSGIQNPPPFLDAIDGVYLLWSAPLAQSTDASAVALAAEAGRLLDTDIQPFRDQISKPVILGVSYPSANGGITGCLPAAGGGCLTNAVIAQPGAELPGIVLDLLEQTDAYNAILEAVNGRAWISGLVARGYYPPVPLNDLSFSTHGKPGGGALWYWFPRLLGLSIP